MSINYKNLYIKYLEIKINLAIYRRVERQSPVQQ